MSIVYDFKNIAAHLKDDKWWTPEKPEPEPVLIEPFGISPAMVLMADLRAEMERMQEEIVRVFAVPLPTPIRNGLFNRTWREINQAKPPLAAEPATAQFLEGMSQQVTHTIYYGNGEEPKDIIGYIPLWAKD